MDAATFAQHAEVEERHWWFTGRRHILLELVARIAAGTRGALLDVGCGTGGNAAAFAAAGYQVLGVDPSADAIGHARRRFPGVTFVQSDDPSVARGHLANGGTALLADVLEHVADDRSLLARTIDVVPKGSHVVITVPADPSLWSPHDTSFGHYRRYVEQDLAALWHDQPVELRLLTPFNARLRPMIAAIRRMRRDDRPTPGGDLDLPVGVLNAALRRVFAGEAAAVVAALDSGRTAYRRGVSLVAVLRRR